MVMFNITDLDRIKLMERGLQIKGKIHVHNATFNKTITALFTILKKCIIFANLNPPSYHKRIVMFIYKIFFNVN